jgi:hypothetical protein
VFGGKKVVKTTDDNTARGPVRVVNSQFVRHVTLAVGQRNATLRVMKGRKIDSLPLFKPCVLKL